MSNHEKVHWENAYSVGIKPIDIQHKKLFDLVNKLYVLEESTTGKEEIREILYAFRDYTIVHFKDEEAYMLAIGYPEFKEHKEIHELIVERLSQIIRIPANLSIIKTKMKVVAKRILVEHIINEDHKIGVYASQHEIKEEIYNITN